MSDKPRWRDRFMDKLPIFGRVRRAKGWLRRNKFWIYAAIAVVVIFMVKPVLTIVAELFKIARPLVSALVDNPVGSFIFYNLLGLLLAYWIWRRMRASVYRVFGLRAMRSFLDGLNAMILGHWRRAIPHFEKVKRIGRWVRLEDAVPEHRDIAIDAHLKIAACFLRLGEPNRAKEWLLRVREKDILTDHVRRHHAELRALSYDVNDEMEAETVLRELEKTQHRDSGNRRVLRALRDRAGAAGDLQRARSVSLKLVAVCEGPEKDEAQSTLSLLEYRLAHKALGEGDAKAGRRALKGGAGDVRAALLLGDLALEDGDVRGALKAWGRAVSLPVFDRIAKLLSDGRLAGDKERALLLEHFPYRGTLIVIAEHHRARGELRKARAALERVLASGGQDISVLRAYAACLEEDGDTVGAQELYRRALSMSFDG